MLLQASLRGAGSSEARFIADFESKFDPPQGALAFHTALWAAVRETVHSEGEAAALAHVAGAGKVFREACVQAGPDRAAFLEHFEAHSDPLFTAVFADGAPVKTAVRFYQGIGEAATVLLDDSESHGAAMEYVKRACEVFETACAIAGRDQEIFLTEFNRRF